ncbi:MAG TPA: FimV/HubP family polar landmark protein [Candidatus Desulfobacillus sp.]|nr:FimV/HubP family polar landmark protein [Candidatus Desulfobacillus sp.]
MDKNLLNLSLKTSLLAAALAALPLGANAAGLGRISVLSALGQPLRAEIELTASRDEMATLTARLASSETFRQEGIEFAPVLADVKVAIDRRSGGKHVIRMTTTRPVNEPFLGLLVEVNWMAGRLVREYTFLLDPAPEVLARKPVAAPGGERGDAAIAQAAPAPVAGGAGGAQKPKAGATTDSSGRQVQKGDYLRKIAAETRPEGVSLDQMLVALFRSNQDAFIGGNMNRLKAGKILTIPDRDAVAAIDAKEARKVVFAQTADFNAYRQRLAAAAASSQAPKEEAAQQLATGKIAAKVEEKASAPAEAKDQLRVSKAESGKGERSAQGRIAALEEDLVTKDKALKEAQSRQAELEKNVQELQKLVELKNQSLAELQQQAAAKAAPAPAMPPPSAEPAKSETPAAAAPPSTDKPAEAPAAADKPAEAPPAAVAQPAETEKPAPGQAAAPSSAPPAPAPAPEPGFLEELTGNPAILGGGAIALLLLGLLAYRRRQGAKTVDASEMPSTAAANVASNSVYGVTSGQRVVTSGSSVTTDFSQASISAIDTDEGVDPVAEADVYMAYGRDAQAEEILLDALKSDPARTAIHVKLLEIYAGRKSNKQFEALASDLYSQTGGSGPDWEKAAAMGLKLDPANPLYGGAAAGEKAAVSADAGAGAPAGEKKMRDTWTMPGELSQISEAVERGGPPTVGLEDLVAPTAESFAEAPVIDFDLDLGETAAPAKAAPGGAPATLDFNLDTDLTSSAARTSFDPDATMVVNQTKEPATPAADLGIDFKLDEPELVASEAPHLDFDLSQTAPAAAAKAGAEPLSAQLADIDFNLGETFAPGAAATGATGQVHGGSGDAGEEVATKLELAQAYEEMGDKEGARELLKEIAEEGSAEQQARTKAMLARLG